MKPKSLVAMITAAAFLAVFLMLAGCAPGTVANLPDKLADRLVGAAETPIARALRFNAIGIVVCELAVDAAVADPSRVVGAAAACERLARAMNRISATAIGPWFHSEMHLARIELYRAFGEGLDINLSISSPAALSLGLVAGLLPGGLATAGKLSALRLDLAALLAPGDLIGDPPTERQAAGMRKILAARFNFTIARLAAVKAIQ